MNIRVVSRRYYQSMVEKIVNAVNDTACCNSLPIGP
jgi:hypothetical protein